MKAFGKIGNEIEFFYNSNILNKDDKNLLIQWLPQKPKKNNFIIKFL